MCCSFKCPWQKLHFSPFLPFYPSPSLSFFDVSSFSQPVIDSKCNHITHSFLWKAPFLMIWQSVDTDCFQKKFQSLFPQLPQAPMINDTCHSVTDKRHRWERQWCMAHQNRKSSLLVFWSGFFLNRKELTRTLSWGCSGALAQRRKGGRREEPGVFK